MGQAPIRDTGPPDRTSSCLSLAAGVPAVPSFTSSEGGASLGILQGVSQYPRLSRVPQILLLKEPRGKSRNWPNGKGRNGIWGR